MLTAVNCHLLFLCLVCATLHHGFNSSCRDNRSSPGNLAGSLHFTTLCRWCITNYHRGGQHIRSSDVAL